MTVQEAIKYLQLALEESDSTEEDGSISELYKEMCKTAIRELEKQIPKKPLADSYGERGMGFLIPICPNCRESVEEGEHHCKCGQALKWGEEDD